MSAQPVSTRTDVAAVGPIDPSTPFLLAGVVPPSEARTSTLRFNGYGLAVMVAIVENAAPTVPVNFGMMEAVMGSMLATGTGPKAGPGRTAIPVYFRLNKPAVSATLGIPFTTFASEFSYYAYTQPEAQPSSLLRDPTTGIPYNLGWDDLNALKLVVPASATAPITLQTFTTAPSQSPDFPGLQAGIRYRIDANNLRGTITYWNSTGVVASGNYQGLPDQIEDSNGNLIRSSLSAGTTDLVLLPVSWLESGCTKLSDITSASFAPAAYHICDRWGKLSPQGTSSPFYRSVCQGTIEQVRGNTSKPLCQLAQSNLYYPSAANTICGDSWPVTTTYLDLTDTVVNATTSMGACPSGVCAYSRTASAYTCLQSTPESGGTGTCTNPCTGITPDCSKCDQCKSVTPVCTADACSTNTTWQTNTNCDKCPAQQGISTLGWILIGVLVVVIIALLILHVKRRSDKTQQKGKESKIVDSPDELELR